MKLRTFLTAVLGLLGLSAFRQAKAMTQGDGAQWFPLRITGPDGQPLVIQVMAKLPLRTEVKPSNTI